MSDETIPAKKRAPRRRKPKAVATAQGDASNPMSQVAAIDPVPVAPESAPVKSRAPKAKGTARKTRRRDEPAAEAEIAETEVPVTEDAAGDELGQARESARAPAPSPPPAPVPPPAPASGQSAPAQRVLMRVPLEVRWRDLDAFNHVNNSKYLSYLEEARLQWMLTLPGQGLDERVAPVVAAAQLNYRRPIEWPAQVTVELFVERLGNTSVTVGHRILGERGGTSPILFCDGHVVMVWIDRTSGSAAPLPTAVRNACT